MSLELIVPVGTSALGWIKRSKLEIAVPSSWFGLNSRAPESTNSPAKPEAAFALLRPLLAEPARTSAEVDSIRAWLQDRGLSGDAVARVNLLVTDSVEGQWCGELAQFLIAKVLGCGRDAVVVRVVGFDTKLDESGARAFVEAISETVRSALAAGRRPIVNATAGLKAESGLALLVGQLMGAEVFYLHERMARPLAFPPLGLQLQLDPGALQILRLLGGAAEHDEARDLGLGRRSDLWAHVVQEDGLWGLSALGQLAVEAAGPAGSAALLPERSGPGEVRQIQDEQGNAPVDEKALGMRILDTCRFVRVAKVLGWKSPGAAGLRAPREGDCEKGVVRVWLSSKESKRRRVRFLLLTTAAPPDGQPADAELWTEARARVGAAFGRAPMTEQLEEQAGEMGLDVPAFSALATEARLLDLNAASEARRRAAEVAAETARNAAARSEKRARASDSRASRAERNAKEAVDRAKAAEKEVARLQGEVVRLQNRVAEMDEGQTEHP